MNHYRDRIEFEQLLDDLRRWNDDASQQQLTSQPTIERDISSITFLNDPSSDNDDAAGQLGTALQVQLQNLSTTRSNIRKWNAPAGAPTAHVQHLYITIQQLSTNAAAYQSLLDYIESSMTHLESITLDGYGDYVPPTVSPVVIAYFLRAIQRNHSKLQKLTLFGCYYIDIHVWVQFLQNCSIRVLDMDCTMFASVPNRTDTEHSSVTFHQAASWAFRYNRTIQQLSFEITEQTKLFVLDILTQLAYNSTLLYLSLEWSPTSFDASRNVVDGSTIYALEQLLSSPSQSVLHHLQLTHFEFQNPIRYCGTSEDHCAIEPILAALYENPNVTTLSWQQCRWDDRNMTVLLYWLGRLRYVQNLQIDFCIPDQTNRDRIQQFLDHVVRRNGYLQQIHITPPRCLLTQDAEYIQKCIQRNIGIRNFLQQWVAGGTLSLPEQPSNCPILSTNLLPVLFAQISICTHGPTWIYNALLNMRTWTC
jgi:hypothetical protein